MDKIFTPNRYFIGFCALLVVAVIAWQITRDQLILEEAKLIGRQEAEWSWPSQGISANVDDIQAKILKRTDNDAEVEVQGKQHIVVQAPDTGAAAPQAGQDSASAPAGAGAPDSVSDFKAVLTLYKQGGSRVWLLGKVEGQ